MNNVPKISEDVFNETFDSIIAPKLWKCKPVSNGNYYEVVKSVAKITFEAGYALGHSDAAQSINYDTIKHHLGIVYGMFHRCRIDGQLCDDCNESIENHISDMKNNILL